MLRHTDNLTRKKNPRILVMTVRTVKLKKGHKMRATISRQYREGNWSIYTDDMTHYWKEFLNKVPFQFDVTNELHKAYAKGFIQALFGSDAQISIDWDTV